MGGSFAPQGRPNDPKSAQELPRLQTFPTPALVATSHHCSGAILVPPWAPSGLHCVASFLFCPFPGSALGASCCPKLKDFAYFLKIMIALKAHTFQRFSRAHYDFCILCDTSAAFYSIRYSFILLCLLLFPKTTTTIAARAIYIYIYIYI